MPNKTTTEIARTLHTDPRTLRKFMRATNGGVGKGARYAIPASKAQIAALHRKFDRWATQHTRTH